MTRTQLVECQALAREFADLAEELERKTVGEKVWFIHGSKLSGQVRRKSMDLTRALADLRRP